MDAIEALEDAIEQAVDENPVETLQVLLGSMVAVLEFIMEDKGEDSSGVLQIETEDGRDVTVHPVKGPLTH